MGEGSDAVAVPPKTDGVRRRWKAAGAVLAVIALSSFLTWWFVPQQLPRPHTVRSAITLPANAEYRFAVQSAGSNVAISSDGTLVVYAGGSREQSQLYLRDLAEMEVKPIAGTKGAETPFFSPDGRWLGFFADGYLKKIHIGGGAPLVLCEAAFGFGGAWSENGVIVFSGELNGGLSRISEDGGTPEPFTMLAEGEGSHRWPALVPDRREVLFAVDDGSSFNWNDARIAVQSQDAEVHRTVLDGGTSPRYSLTGHLVYARSGSLLAVPYDSSSGNVTAPPRSLVQAVAMTAMTGDAHYALAMDGTLVNVSGGSDDAGGPLVWVDRNGDAESLHIARRGFEMPRLSPDGRRVAVTIREGNSDAWVIELERGTMTRLTSERAEDHSVAWTPDGKRVTYSSTRGTESHIMIKNADGSGEAERFFVAGQHQHIGGWTPDGTLLITDGGMELGSDLYFASVTEEVRPRIFVATTFDEQSPQLSPDGRWVAYRSDESGKSEVYVQSFPEPGARWPISTDGGTEPVWSPDGQELFYRNGDKLMVVAVELGSTVRAGAPRVLFEAEYATVLWQDANYDVSPDGNRFLMIGETRTERPSQLNLVLNWTEELKSILPVDN
jgi:serine/threonine-protein kinase